MKLKDIAKLCAKTHSIGISEVSGLFVTAIIIPREPDAKEADSLLRKFNRLALAMEEIAEPAVPVDPNTGEVREFK